MAGFLAHAAGSGTAPACGPHIARGKHRTTGPRTGQWNPPRGDETRWLHAAPVLQHNGRLAGPGTGPAGPFRRTGRIRMNERFRAIVYATVFAVLLGWVLYIGREILVPIVFSIMVMYVILGAARLLSRVPVIGPALPVQAHYALSTLLMLGALLV